MRILRFLWLLTRGVLIVVGCFLALLAFVGAMHAWIGADVVLLCIVVGMLLFLLGGLAWWVHDCWVAAGTERSTS